MKPYLNCRMQSTNREVLAVRQASDMFQFVWTVCRFLALLAPTAAPSSSATPFSDANWIGLNPAGANGVVNAVAGDDSNHLYVGGAFTVLGGVPASRIAQWNGSVWSPVDAGMNNAVHVLAMSGNDLYAGGAFTMAGGNLAKRIAKWNGSAWSPVGPGMNGSVYALAVSGNDLYAGGQLHVANGDPGEGIAKWNGSAWTPLGLGLNADVRALAVMGGDLYAGFVTPGGSFNHIAKWNGSAWSALGSGMNNSVYALAVLGGELYAGGRFTTAGGSSAAHIAKWNGSAWFPVGAGMNGNVQALAVVGSDLYAGGTFTAAGGNPANRIAKWDGNAWSPLGSGIDTGSEIDALAASDTSLYAGGIFSKAGGKPTINVAKAALVTPPTPEATFCADFNSGVPPGMSLFGDARVDAGRLELYSVPDPGGFGIAYVDDFSGGRFVQGFRATFNAAVFGSTTFPADGFSFNLVPAVAARANPGYAEPAEEGLDEGLSINFDTFDNGGGEAPAVEIKWLGRVIASKPFQASQSPGATDPVSASREVIIELDAGGRMNVSYGGASIFTDEPTPYDPAVIRTPKWVLGARVGFGNDNYWFDDLCIATLPAPGRQIPLLFNTGVDDSGVPLADDAVDPHYRRPGNADVYVATEAGGFPIPPWLGTSSRSAWISTTRDTWAPSDRLETYHFIYETTFDLTGFDHRTARLAGRWATDNKGMDILINGSPLRVENLAEFGSWTPFAIESEAETGLSRFVAGINRLAFVVNNGAPGVAPGSDPTGLRVEVWGAAALDCNVVRASPPLGISRQGGSLSLSWRQSGFVLQRTSNLGGIWQDVTRGTSVNGRDYTVTLPASGSAAFFRLRADCD